MKNDVHCSIIFYSQEKKISSISYHISFKKVYLDKHQDEFIVSLLQPDSLMLYLKRDCSNLDMLSLLAPFHYLISYNGVCGLLWIGTQKKVRKNGAKM